VVARVLKKMSTPQVLFVDMACGKKKKKIVNLIYYRSNYFNFNMTTLLNVKRK